MAVRGALLLTVLGVLGVVPLPLGCGRPAPARVTALGGDVAGVGSVGIPAPLLESVARVQQVPPRAALGLLVQDALLAQGASAVDLEGDPAVSWGSTAALARLVAKHVWQDARTLGPPTSDELARRTVVHAVVLRGPAVSDERAFAQAKLLERAVHDTHGAEEFEARAKEVSHPGVRVVVERITGLGADGRTVNGEEIDASFVAAAFELRAPGDTSPLVETTYGWHVLRLVERLPPAAQEVEERGRDLAQTVVDLRARKRLAELLRASKAATPVEIAPGADSLIAGAARPP